jgi:DNA-binding NarL/FixJ family response regulator
MLASPVQRKVQTVGSTLKVATQLAASAEFKLAQDILVDQKSPGAMLLAAQIALRMSKPQSALKTLKNVIAETPAQAHLKSVLQSVAEARLASGYQEVLIPSGASESTRHLGLYYRGMQQAKFDLWLESKETAKQITASTVPSIRCLGFLLEAYYETHRKDYSGAIELFVKAFETLQESSQNDEWIRTSIVAGMSSLVVETLQVNSFKYALDAVATLTPTTFTRRRAADSFSIASQILALTGSSLEAYNILLKARGLALDDSPALASIEIDLAKIMDYYAANEVAALHRENAKRILFSNNWTEANADDRLVLVFYAIDAFHRDKAGASRALTLALSRTGATNPRDLLEHDERASILAKFAEALVLADRQYDASVAEILACQKRWLSIGYKYRVVEAGIALLEIGYSDSQAVVDKLLKPVPRSLLKGRVKELKNALASPIQTLSAAEMRVAEAICEGLTSKQIAERFDRSPSTIRNQTIAIYRALGVSTRSALVALMKDSGAA